MQSLGLYTVHCTYSEISNTEQGLSNIDIITDWNYDRGRSVANFIYSYNADVYRTSNVLNVLESKTGITSTNFRKLSDIDLYCNCPATIEYSQDSSKKTTKVFYEEIDRDISYQYVSYVTYTLNTNNYELSSYYRIYNTNTQTEIITNYVANDDGSITSYSNTTEADGSITMTYTTTNENGITTGSYSYTQHPNGSTASSELNYDENGNLTNEHNTTQNADGSHSDQTITYDSDGSSEGHTTNYDSNDNPVSGENQWNDPLGNQNTQAIEYDSNGDPEVVGYTIDTSGNESGTGETLEESLNTGFIAFDGRSFTITADFEFNCADLGTQYFKTLLSALEPADNGTYNGFYIRNGSIDSTISTSNNYKFTFFARSNSGITFSNNGRGNGYTFGSTCYFKKTGKARYQLTVNYSPGSDAGSFNATVKPTYTNGTTLNSSGTTIDASNNSSIPPRMDNAIIILGGNGVSPNFDIINLTVYSFNVVKTS